MGLRLWERSAELSPILLPVSSTPAIAGEQFVHFELESGSQPPLAFCRTRQPLLCCRDALRVLVTRSASSARRTVLVPVSTEPVEALSVDRISLDAVRSRVA